VLCNLWMFWCVLCYRMFWWVDSSILVVFYVMCGVELCLVFIVCRLGLLGSMSFRLLGMFVVGVLVVLLVLFSGRVLGWCAVCCCVLCVACGLGIVLVLWVFVCFCIVLFALLRFCLLCCVVACGVVIGFICFLWRCGCVVV